MCSIWKASQALHRMFVFHFNSVIWFGSDPFACPSVPDCIIAPSLEMPLEIFIYSAYGPAPPFLLVMLPSLVMLQLLNQICWVMLHFYSNMLGDVAVTLRWKMRVGFMILWLHNGGKDRLGMHDAWHKAKRTETRQRPALGTALACFIMTTTFLVYLLCVVGLVFLLGYSSIFASNRKWNAFVIIVNKIMQAKANRKSMMKLILVRSRLAPSFIWQIFSCNNLRWLHFLRPPRPML